MTEGVHWPLYLKTPKTTGARGIVGSATSHRWTILECHSRASRKAYFPTLGRRLCVDLEALSHVDIGGCNESSDNWGNCAENFIRFTQCTAGGIVPRTNRQKWNQYLNTIVPSGSVFETLRRWELARLNGMDYDQRTSFGLDHYRRATTEAICSSL